MSVKRISPEPNYNVQTNEDLISTFQSEYDVKRAKLDPVTCATLQDLPIELLEGILVKTVVMEVKGLKVAKRTWKEKAGMVISRLTPISSQWSDVLTTNSFRMKVHRILDGSAQTIRLEIFQDYSIRSQNLPVTTLKDDTFLLYRQPDGYYFINVYNSGNMKEVKEVIPVPRTDSPHMTGGKVSDCIYTCLRQGDSHSLKVLRMSRNAEHKFNTPPLINDQLTNDRSTIKVTVSVSDDGIITLSFRGLRLSAVVSVYDADGALQQEVKSPDVDVVLYKDTILKSNESGNGNRDENVVLAYVGDQHFKQRLSGLDTSLVRQFQSSIAPSNGSCVDLADNSGRKMITRLFKEIELLDSEFNLFGVYSEGKDTETLLSLIDLRYDRNQE